MEEALQGRRSGHESGSKAGRESDHELGHELDEPRGLVDRPSGIDTRARRHLLALTLIAFAFLLLGASPAHFWLDSGEIAAAGAELGVMHPPGAAGYVGLLHLATALPLGSLGFRMAAVSSACMAGALALLLAVLVRRRAHPATLWLVAVWLLLGLTLVRNGRVVEVYGFAALLLMATLWGFDPAVPGPLRVSRRCIGVLAAVLAAWGFGDLRLALAPPILLVWVLAWRRAEPWARWAPLAVALASLAVLTLPLSSARGPMTDWGNPDGWSALWAHVQAHSIRDSFAERLAGMGWRAWSLHARQVAARLAEDLGPIGLLGAVAALAAGVARPLAARERARREGQGEATIEVDDDHRLLRWVAWIAVVELVYAVALNPMGGRDRQTGLVFALLAGLAVGIELERWLAARRVVLRWILGPLLAVALWVPAAFESLPDLRATRSWAPHAWTREVLARTPEGSLLLTQSDDLSAGVLAARVLEGARPDLVTMAAQQLYRRPSEWQLADPRRAGVWEAADSAEATGERLARAIASWRGPVALESPSVAVLEGIVPPSRRGWVLEPPLWLLELPPGEEAVVASRLELQGSLEAAVARWEGRLDSAVDRARLADALALWIHGAFVRSPESPRRWLEAEAGYRLILEEVLPDHPRSLVGLAATRDRFGRTEEAIRLTRRALEIDPERATALANLALYLSRNAATLEEAREVAELAVQLAADSRVTWGRLLAVCRVQTDAECIARARGRLDGG